MSVANEAILDTSVIAMPTEELIICGTTDLSHIYLMAFKVSINLQKIKSIQLHKKGGYNVGRAAMMQLAELAVARNKSLNMSSSCKQYSRGIFLKDRPHILSIS